MLNILQYSHWLFRDYQKAPTGKMKRISRTSTRGSSTTRSPLQSLPAEEIPAIDHSVGRQLKVVYARETRLLNLQHRGQKLQVHIPYGHRQVCFSGCGKPRLYANTNYYPLVPRFRNPCRLPHIFVFIS